jgi:hypothetical protein
MPNLSERKIRFPGREAALRNPELRESVAAKELLMSRCPAPPLAPPKAAASLSWFRGHRPDPPVPEEGDGRNTKIALRSLLSGGTARQNAMNASPTNKKNGEMTMSQNASLPSKLTKVDANTQFTEAYVRQMANELAEPARSAGCRRLSALLTLASIEAETSPPVFQLTRPQPTVT